MVITLNRPGFSGATGITQVDNHRGWYKEIKRRSNVVGIFPNDAAIIRLVGALMLEQNDEWAVARRYMALESLAQIVDDYLVRLPAVAL